MPALSRIYTRGGDGGETSLGSGRRVSKDDPRLEAYGTVDELNSVLGAVLAFTPCADLRLPLARIQNELFHLGSDLCYREDDKVDRALPRMEDRHVAVLEAEIDQYNEEVGPLRNFVLPGGAPAASLLHLGRTVCRRAERLAVNLRRSEPIGPLVVPYLNRLSDWLFVASRLQNLREERPETLWNSRL